MITYKEILSEARVLVNTSEWEKSNIGKTPKGSGLWIFALGSKNKYEKELNNGNLDSDLFLQISGKYEMAKKKAMNIAKNKKIKLITVLP